MRSQLVGIFLVAIGLAVSGVAQTIVPNKATPDDPTRLVDGVDLLSYQAIQNVLLETAAGESEVTSIDDQMEMLRALRADLCFKAAAKTHPELADKLKIVQDKQHERMLLEKTTARDAKLAAKKKN